MHSITDKQHTAGVQSKIWNPSKTNVNCLNEDAGNKDNVNTEDLVHTGFVWNSLNSKFNVVIKTLQMLIST